MPSYNLTKDIRDVIRGRFMTAMIDYRARAQAGFPLHAERLQEAIISEEFAPVWEGMKVSRASVVRTGGLTVALRKKDFPVTRGAVINLSFSIQWAVYQPDPSTREPLWFTPDFTEFEGVSYLHRLTHAERQAVAEWTDNAVQACRLARMATDTFRWLLPQLDSTACLMNTWPMLATLVDEGKWKERFRSPPQKNYLAKYHLPHVVMEKYAPRIKIIDGLLAMNMVLGNQDVTVDIENGDIRARVDVFEGEKR